ncbi:PilZ domain-containing protein [Catenovulum sp. SM1970]|uniref:PilZ domain-containing protein n=1 Tax=Marinifaba aquimaris TaxID=2741323 RepID=UPI0015718E4B|nr:PilZ domain-containing protein [Marinifaba aquimaris]NTS77165.1 PilZ domain-containing protein [Marinifaba aquimaris]
MQSQAYQLDGNLKKIADSLVTAYKTEKFEQVFAKSTAKLDRGQQFKIKSELARLFKPFERTIDLTDESDYRVEEFEWNGKRFYFDDIAKRIFLIEVERFGDQYTEGVYERIKDKANYQAFEKQFVYEQKIKQYEVPITELGLTTRRLEERIYLSKPVSLFLPNGYELQVFSSNISRSGLLIKVEPFGSVQKDSIVEVNFHALTRDYVFNQTAKYKYRVVFCASKAEKDGTQKIGLQLVDNDFEWSQFLDKFIKEHRTRFQVDITNASQMVESRLIEDHLLKKTGWFSIYVSAQDDKLSQAGHGLCNQLNRKDLNFFADETKAQRIHTFLVKVWSELALNRSECIAVAKIKQAGKISFYARSVQNLANKGKLESFFQFAQSNGELGLFTCQKLAITEAQLEQVKHNWFKTAVEADIALSPLGRINHLVLLHRMSEHESLMKLKPSSTPIDANNLAEFACPKLKAINFSALNVEPGCARAEVRYFFQTQAVLNKPNQPKLAASTLDLSCHGMRVQLKATEQLEQGDIVEISIPSFERFGRANMLSKAKFRVVGLNPALKQAHLCLLNDNNQHATADFVKKVLKANAAKLKVNDKYDKFILLQKALRTVFVTFYPAIAFGVLRDNKALLGFNRILVSSKSVNELQVLSELQSPISDNQISVFQLIYDPKRNPTFIRSLTRFSKNAEALSDELIFNKLPNRIDIPKHARAGGNPKLTLDYVRGALKTGEFASLYMNIQSINEMNLDCVADAFKYIQAFNPHKAIEIENFAKQLMGIVEVLDTSMLWRHTHLLPFEYDTSG